MQGFPGVGHTERLIVVAVVAVAAAVLLPQWLNRSEDEPTGEEPAAPGSGAVVRSDATVLAVEPPNRLVVDLAGERVAVVPRATEPSGDAEAAAAALRALAAPDGTVRLVLPESDADRRPMPAWIDLEDGRNVSRELIASGHARLDPAVGGHPEDARRLEAIGHPAGTASPTDGDHHP